MATQTRVPGAASSEVDFELERFERTADDRIEISGRWYGLRGRRFVRPVLNLNAGGSRRRAIALLEHKPWAAEDGQVWLAAFRWPDGTGDVSGAELEVGPGLLVDLPALGGTSGAAVRVSALRPHTPAVPPWRSEEGEGGADHAGHIEGALREPPGRAAAADRESSGNAAGSGREPFGRAAGSGRESSGNAARSGREPSGHPEPPHREPSGRAAAPHWTDAPPPRDTASPRDAAPPRDTDGSDLDAPQRDSSRAASPDWVDTRRESRGRASPPRDVVTAARAERDEAIAARDDAERDRVTALQDRDDALSRRDAALRDVDRAISERDQAVAERDRVVAELERITRERDIAHAERKRTLQDAEAVARERDQAAAEREAARSELSRALPARDEAIRERDAQLARAEQAERERDTAFAERKSAVAQRDRARRERDRAMRAAGVEPPEESPYVARAGEPAAPPGPAAREQVLATADRSQASAAPPGTPLPTRPVKRIGVVPAGPPPEPKPLLTPVDAGRPRRLSRTRRTPSAPARWAVRITVVLLMIAIAVVLVMLLGTAL